VYKLITSPVSEPLSVEEAKAYLRVDTDDDDNVIDRLITTCSQSLDDYCEISLLSQTWELCTKSLPREITLSRGPVQSITDIKSFIDGTGTIVGSYYYYTEADYNLLKLKTVYQWPVADYYKVRYLTGYSTKALIPEALKQGLLELIAYRYESRDNKDIPDEVKQLVSKYKVYKV
jgi:uncharacterized phiE125 gp8 family phage protein